MEKYRSHHLVGIRKLIADVGTDISEKDKQEIKELWSKNVGSVRSCIYIYFYDQCVIKNRDCAGVRGALVTTVLILIGITLLDLYNSAQFQQAGGILLPLIAEFLIVSILLPGMFWYLWNKFLAEYQCFFILLAKAYQKNVERELEKETEKLKS